MGGFSAITSQVPPQPTPPSLPPGNIPNPQAGVGPEPAPMAPMPQQGSMPQVSTPAPQVKGPSPWQRAVHALLGTTTEYRPSDPNNPNSPPAPYQVPNKPGNLFRSILAGAILGAGAGTANSEHNAGSGWGAAGAGARAVQQNQQQQDLLKQQQAQQQWQNQLKQNQENREETQSKAQIAMWNLQKLKALQDIQGEGWDKHQQYVDKAAPIVAGYQAAGLKPIPGKEHVSETAHLTWLNDPAHKGDTTVDWEPVGVVPYTVDVNGEKVVSYQTVWNAYNKTDSIPVTPGLLDRWAASGMASPEVLNRYVKTASDGTKTLKYDDFVTLNSKAMALEQTKQAADDRAAANKERDLKLQLAQLQITHENKAIGNEDRAARAAQLKSQNDEWTRSAKKKLLANGSDWTPADPSKPGDAKIHLTPDEIIAMQPDIISQLNGINSELRSDSPLVKAMDDSSDPAAQKEAKTTISGLVQKQEQLNRLVIGTGGGAGGNTSLPAGDSTIPNLVKKYSFGLTPEAATNFNGAAQALQNGTPLSTILTNLANSRDIKPSDKTAMADKLIKLNAELSLLLSQTKQENDAAQNKVQQLADTANEQENPSAATTFKLATAPASIASRPGQR